MMGAFLDFKPVRKAIDDAVCFGVELLNTRVNVEGFTPAKISFELTPRKTFIKSFYAFDCAICENELMPYNVRKDSFAACQPKLTDVHYQRLDLNFEVPALSRDALSELSFLFWIRPPKGAKDVFCILRTDHVIPVMPAILDL